MAPILSASTASEKSGLPLPATDTSASSFSKTNSPSQRRRSYFTFTMRASLIALFGLAYLGAALTPRVPCNHDHSHGPVNAVANHANLPSGPAVDESTFSSMLNSVSPENLHKLLHSHLPGMYRHGVYESDRHAAEMLHKKDARLATSLVRMAKRQSNSSSVVTEPSSSEQTTQLPTETDTSSQAQTTPSSTTTTTTATTTEENSDTSTTEAPTTLTTTTPTLVTSESLTTFTSTDAAGNVQVVTSTAMVVVRPSSTSSSASATSTPDLQNAASRRPAAGAMAVPAVLAMAAVGGFLAL